LESSAFSNLGTLYFTNSWILQGTAAARLRQSINEDCTPLKQSLKDSIVGIGTQGAQMVRSDVTRVVLYFRRVLSSELLSCVSLAATLEDRVVYLQTIMYQLSEQTKSGVPMAFRDAYDADTVDDQDDVELQPPQPLLLSSVTANAVNSANSAVHKTSATTTHAVAAVVVID
jgi:hypothetical protein